MYIYSDQVTHIKKRCCSWKDCNASVLTAQVLSAERTRVALRGVLATRPYNGVLATRPLQFKQSNRTIFGGICGSHSFTHSRINSSTALPLHDME